MYYIWNNLYIYVCVYIEIQTIITELGASKRQISQLVSTCHRFQGNLFEIVKITNKM